MTNSSLAKAKTIANFEVVYKFESETLLKVQRSSTDEQSVKAPGLSSPVVHQCKDKIKEFVNWTFYCFIKDINGYAHSSRSESPFAQLPFLSSSPSLFLG